MGRAAQYLIAQHIADPFRNEPRNVGVIVRIEDERTARFVGEISENKIDGKRVRSLPYPEVYRQWVDHWWRLVKSGAKPTALVESSKEHYRIIDGGEVSDIGNDSVHDIANYLFAALVSEGNLAMALGGEDEADADATPLKDDISGALAAAQVLAADDQATVVPHPVRRNVSVKGQSTTHRPAFAQENGVLLVMDAVDLTTSKVATARDRAGFLAFMFGDIKIEHANAEMISIVRSTSADEKNPNIEYALEMLESKSRIVNWLSEADRKTFIQQRVETSKH